MRFAGVAMLFQIKICGVRVEGDVRAVADSGADAIGLNFFPPSVRYVSPSAPRTRELSQLASHLGLTRVGVFVNESDLHVRSVSETVGLDVIQLHGDESIDSLERMLAIGLPVVRAIKLPAVGSPETETNAQGYAAHVQRLAAPWIEHGCHVLFDADAGAAHGGSGKTIPWGGIRAWSAMPNTPPVPTDAGDSENRIPTGHQSTWTLAGGLNPTNVATAIDQSTARSVDTASGVESPKGVKSESLIHAFVHQARAAMATN